MKNLRIIFTLLCLTFSITIMAQSTLDNTLTTSGGMTLQYPSSYIGEANDELSVGLLEMESNIFLALSAGESAFDFTGEEAQTSEELKNSFVGTLEIFNGLMDDEPIQELLINNRPAFLVPFDTDSIGRGYLLSFELADGTVISSMLFGASGTEIPAEMVEDLKAIAVTVTIDASLATSPDTSESTIIEDSTSDSTESDIPSGAILIEDMPEGMILTGSGLQMPTLEGFGFIPGIDYIENSVGLISSNFQNTIIISDGFELKDGELDLYMRTLIPTIALIAGDEDFNPDTDMQTIDVDGRTITYYDSSDFAEEDSDIAVYYFIIELIPESGRIAVVQVMYSDGGSDVFESNLFEFVQAIQLTEEEIADIEAPDEIDCGTQGLRVVTADNTTAIIRCPVGCDATTGGLWGTEIYTSDSSICLAAVHMGLIDDMGGNLLVTYIEGQDSYTSTNQNGVESSAYDAWSASFSVSVPEGE